MQTNKRQNMSYNIKKQPRSRDCSNHFTFLENISPLELAAKQEIINSKTNPAKSQNENRKKDLADKTGLSRFEDVEYTPYCAYKA